MRFSSTPGMPAKPRLQARVKNGFPGYSSAYKSKFFGDEFGAYYQIVDIHGNPLPVDWNDMYWYVFVK